MFPELMQLLKGEKRHRGLKDTWGKQGRLYFLEKRRADQKSWEAEGLCPTLPPTPPFGKGEQRGA